MNLFLNIIKGKIGTNIKCHKRAYCNRNNMWRCNVAMVMWSRVCELIFTHANFMHVFERYSFNRKWYLIRQLSRGLSKGDLHQHVLGRMINAIRARWSAWTTCMGKSRKFIKTKLLNWDENESPQRVSFEKIRENLKRHDPPVTKNATFALFNSKMMLRFEPFFITETRL